MGFWEWTAASKGTCKLHRVQSALRCIERESLSAGKISLREMSSLCKAILDPVELLSNPILRSEIIANIPAQARQTKHFLSIRKIHEEIATREPTSKQIGILLDLFSLTKKTLEPTQSNNSVDASYHQKANYALFPHQREVLCKAYTQLTSSENRCIIHMPTGTGKTRTAMSLVARWLNNNNGSVVWVTYSKELITQAAAEFRKCWAHQGQYEATVSFYTGELNTFSQNPEFDICFTSFGKIGREAVQEDKDGLISISRKTSLVIIDEAHQALAPTYKGAIDFFTFYYNRCALLGLTATPGRTTGQDETANIELSQLFGNRKVTLEIKGYQSPISYLMENGFLARPEYEIFKSPENERQISTADLIGRIKESIDSNHKRIIVFTKSVEEATLCTGILEFLGIRSFSINADLSLDERNAAYVEYLSDSRMPIVLCNYGVLTTGFDAPKTSCVIIARPVNSLVVYSQIVGRALRGPAARGTESAKIITMLATEDKDFLDLVNTFDRWNSQWSQAQ
jgi:DNA repair protein RadD